MPTVSRRSWQELPPDSVRDGLPTIRARQKVYANPRQVIYRVEADFGRFTKEYFVNEYLPRAGVVAIRDGCVLLVRQYRLLIDGISWELPGGGVDDGETPAEAAARECLEETGITCSNLRPLLTYRMDLDTQNNTTYLFHTDEVSGVSEPARVHHDEVAGFEWVPFDRAIEMVFAGRIEDSFSAIGLLSYRVSPDTIA
jgi:ADP-ribose pyrophosphatase